MKKRLFFALTVFTVFIFSISSNAQLSVKAVVSTDYSFYDQWYRTVGESVPLVSEAKTVYHDQPIFVYVFFGNYGIDSLGTADVTYNFRLFRPDSSQVENFTDIIGYKGRINNPSNILLSVANVRLKLESFEPVGSYRIEIEIIDNIMNDTAALVSGVALKELTLKSAINNDSLFNNWMTTYYQSPLPEYAIDAFIYFSKSDIRKDIEEIAFAFFRELFNNNNYLLPYLVEQYDFQDEVTQNDIITLMAFLDAENSEFLNKLSDNVLNFYNELRKDKSVFDYSILEHPAQLDMLWSEFFASGRYDPVMKLVNALSLNEYTGSIEKYKESDNNESLRHDVLMEAVYKSAVWSLRENARTHKLVKDYLIYILKNETLEENIRNELEKIVIK